MHKWPGMFSTSLLLGLSQYDQSKETQRRLEWKQALFADSRERFEKDRLGTPASLILLF